MTTRRKLLIATAALGLVGALVAGGFASETSPAPALPPTSPSSVAAGAGVEGVEGQLHQDYNMTRYMGDPGAAGPMFSGQMVDPQLQHSQNPSFVAALEQHQADMDRMLGKGQP